MTKESIKAFIKGHTAAEFEKDCIVYYLHISDDGSIVDDVRKADVSFEFRLSPEDFGLTQEQYESAESPESVYDHEVDGDPIYERIVSSLYEQAVRYLEGCGV